MTISSSWKTFLKTIFKNNFVIFSARTQESQRALKDDLHLETLKLKLGFVVVSFVLSSSKQCYGFNSMSRREFWGAWYMPCQAASCRKSLGTMITPVTIFFPQFKFSQLPFIKTERCDLLENKGMLKLPHSKTRSLYILFKSSRNYLVF